MSRFPIYHEMGLGMDPMAAANLAYAGARYRRREAVERPAVINAREPEVPDITREAAGIAGLAETEVVGAREEAEFRAAEAGRMGRPGTPVWWRQVRGLIRYGKSAQDVARGTAQWAVYGYTGRGEVEPSERDKEALGRMLGGRVTWLPDKFGAGRHGIVIGTAPPMPAERALKKLTDQAKESPQAFLTRATAAGVAFEEPGPPVEARFEPREQWSLQGGLLIERTTGQVKPVTDVLDAEALKNVRRAARALRGVPERTSSLITLEGRAYGVTTDAEGNIELRKIMDLERDSRWITKTVTDPVTNEQRTFMADVRARGPEGRPEWKEATELRVEGSVPTGTTVWSGVGLHEGIPSIARIVRRPDGTFAKEIHALPKGWVPQTEQQREAARKKVAFTMRPRALMTIDEEGNRQYVLDENGVPKSVLEIYTVPLDKEGNVDPTRKPQRVIVTGEEEQESAKGRPAAAEPPAPPPSPEESYLGELMEKARALKPAADAGDPKAKAEVERLIALVTSIQKGRRAIP